MGSSFFGILFAISAIVLVYFYGKKMLQVKELKQRQHFEYEENRLKYRNFSSELFDETPNDKLTPAVMFHIMAKEDQLYEGDEIAGTLKDVLTHGELLIYTIFQVEASMEGGRGSIHTFFINEPYCIYRPYVQEAFETVDCHEIAEVMEAAEKLAIMIENDEEIDDDNDQCNFADYTDTLMSMFKSLDVVSKTGKYIRENKSDFISTEVETDE